MHVPTDLERRILERAAALGCDPQALLNELLAKALDKAEADHQREETRRAAVKELCADVTNEEINEARRTLELVSEVGSLDTRSSDAIGFLESLPAGPLTFGRLIRSIREGDEVAIDVFSETLGVAACDLEEIESGRRAVTVERANGWARLLGYNPTQFAELAMQARVSVEEPEWSEQEILGQQEALAAQMGLSVDDAYAALDRGEFEGTIFASEMSMLRHLLSKS